MSVLGKGMAVLAAALVLMLAAYGGINLASDLREPSPARAASNQMMGMGSSGASMQEAPEDEMVELCTRHMEEMQPVMERMMGEMMRDMMR